MSYDAAKAKELDYKCSMDESRLVPTLETSWGTISFSTDPWPARSGTMNVEVRPLDRDAQPINDAEVSLTLSMPGRRLRSDDKVVALRPNRDGLYATRATLPLAGRWLATVTVKHGDEADALSFDFDMAQGNEPQSPPSKADGRSDKPAHKGAARQPPPTGATAVSYTCQMHPEMVQSQPGKCPKCVMNLVKKQ